MAHEDPDAVRRWWTGATVPRRRAETPDMTELRRNDPALYDSLADEWWRASGGFAALHWLAASRAEHIPPAPGPDAVLVDLACGGGLMAPHVARLG